MTENQKFKKYLSIYKKNPKSKVFVLLSELYRKKGEQKKALHLCQKGLEFHPQLSAGYIAQALVLLDMDKQERASQALEKATQISPENILAYKLLGQCYLKLNKPLKTLSAYKMLLFLDPNNKIAQNIVKKLEPITASQYDETGFSFKSLKEMAKHIEQHKTEQKGKKRFPSLYPIMPKEDKQFQARLAIIEALIYRKDFNKASQFILEMKNIYPKQAKALKKWERLLPPNPLMEATDNLDEEQEEFSNQNSPKTASQNQSLLYKTHQSSLNTSSNLNHTRQKKIQKLNHLLSRVEKGGNR